MSTNDICDICRLQLRDDEFGMFCENCLYEDPEQQEIIEKYPPIKIVSYIDTDSQYIHFQNTYLQKMLSYAIQQINLEPNVVDCLDTKDNDDVEKQSEKSTSYQEESGEDDKC